MKKQIPRKRALRLTFTHGQRKLRSTIKRENRRKRAQIVLLLRKQAWDGLSDAEQDHLTRALLRLSPRDRERAWAEAKGRGIGPLWASAALWLGHAAAQAAW